MYRAHFCGLCNRLRRDYGLPMRFLVNRDATFLSILGTALHPDSASPVYATCCNPLGIPRPVVQEGDAVSYAAAVTLCGLSAKLDDEVLDRRSRPAGIACRGLRGVLSRPICRAEATLKGRGFPVAAVRDALSEQSFLEEEACARGRPDLDALCRPSAFAFGQIVAHTGERAGKALERIGESLGRLMYTLDAFVDRQRDERSRQFNPFLLRPGLMEEVPDFLERDLQAISVALGELPLMRHRDVLAEVLGSGLRRTCTAMWSGRASGRPGAPEERKRGKRSGQDLCGGCCDGWGCCDCAECGLSCCDCDGFFCGCDCP